MIFFQSEHFFDILEVQRVFINILENLILCKIHPTQVTSADS